MSRRVLLVDTDVDALGLLASALRARVVAVDVAPAALDLARALGAEVALDAGVADLPTLIGEVTGGGAHVSIDALGSANSRSTARTAWPPATTPP